MLFVNARGRLLGPYETYADAARVATNDPDAEVVGRDGPVELALVDEQPAAEPQPPELAQYLLDAVDRQDPDDLRDLAHYALERAAWLDRDLDPDDVDVDDAEELVDVKNTSSGTKVIKKVPCGKDSCTTCPHGPYEYRNYREGDKVRTEYIGPADS